MLVGRCAAEMKENWLTDSSEVFNGKDLGAARSKEPQLALRSERL
jgi:hypothetical protein